MILQFQQGKDKKGLLQLPKSLDSIDIYKKIRILTEIF